MEKQVNHLLFIYILLMCCHLLTGTKKFIFILFCIAFTALINFISSKSAEDSHGAPKIATKTKTRQHHLHRNVKLFVFGDSYADTGNWPKSASSWNQPYGSTVPSKPAGRFSDGRVLTDYIASFLGVKSPVPFIMRKTRSKEGWKNGMNFAFGGTGAYDTLVKAPNMSTQINYFDQLLQQKVYDKEDLTNSSIALVSLAGNDYGTYLANNRSIKDMPSFTKSVIDVLSENMKRIHGLGVQKIAVTALEPMGCLPQFSSLYSYKNCSKSSNDLSIFHNQMLQQAVLTLNSKTLHKDVFHILDLYSAFNTALKKAEFHAGELNLRNYNALEPCCVGVERGNSCGEMDKSGQKKYLVCQNPNISVFWDMVHPSHNGWRLAFLSLKLSLHRFYVSR